MDVNDDAGLLEKRGAHTSIASLLAMASANAQLSSDAFHSILRPGLRFRSLLPIALSDSTVL